MPEMDSYDTGEVDLDANMYIGVEHISASSEETSNPAIAGQLDNAGRLKDTSRLFVLFLFVCLFSFIYIKKKIFLS